MFIVGTGKTIVGVYIVWNFFVSNSETPRKFKGEKDKDKSDVILYCGPSNKAVDVVAGKFIFVCFGGFLKKKISNDYFSVCCHINA